MIEKVLKGSIVDYIIHIDAWGGVVPDYFDFKICFFTPDGKELEINKKNLLKEDDYYRFSLDTTLLGVGSVKAKIHATDSSKQREEIIIVSTGTKIIEYELPNC